MEEQPNAFELCPLGRTNRDLLRRTLNPIQENWIGYKISSKELSVQTQDIHEAYNIPIANIYRYTELYKNGYVFYDGVGRPPCLGELQKEQLLTFLRTSAPVNTMRSNKN